MNEREFDVLVVDDEPVVLSSARKILSLEDVSVDEALDGETALKKLENGHYKIVMTDLMLPKISGFELVDIIRNLYPELITVMITGYATLENAVKALKIGIFDFVPKPFEIEEMQGVVSRALRFATARKETDPISQWAQIRTEKAPNAEFYFLGKHAWARLDDDGSALIGAAETFPACIGPIERVEFPDLGEEIGQGNSCVRIFSTDELIHTVWSPLSGKLIEVNTALHDNPELLNTDPFFDGWLGRVIPGYLEPELTNLVKR